MSGNVKKEFGDYQTPLDFCYRVCNYIKESRLAEDAAAIMEPTCGVGNFLLAASNTFACSKLIGIEVNAKRADAARIEVPSATIETNDIFNVSTKTLCGEDCVLVIGNPPWATNSELSFNLPPKTNFKGLRGIEAITGSSNFDICEYIILKLIGEYKHTNSTICMLCKTSVARNVVSELSRNHIAYQKVEMLNFNSSKIFGISASACVLIIKLSTDEACAGEIVCEVKDFDKKSVIDTLSVELDRKDNDFINKNKTAVRLENGLVFPLVKSSHFKKPIIHDFSKFVIVTQTKPKQDTAYIQKEYPLTWKYLNDNIESFDKRKSVIYKETAPFSMFGIGDYSFAPYKVALSGFYKKPLFCLLYASKPVMTDDTAYFLAFYDYNIAYSMMLLLNSKTVQEFLLSIAFLDNKRPYTVKLLSRLDIQKCLEAVPFEGLKQTEAGLKLPPKITETMYRNLAQFVREQA